MPAPPTPYRGFQPLHALNCAPMLRADCPSVCAWAQRAPLDIDCGEEEGTSARRGGTETHQGTASRFGRRADASLCHHGGNTGRFAWGLHVTLALTGSLFALGDYLFAAGRWSQWGTGHGLKRPTVTFFKPLTYALPKISLNSELSVT